MKKRGVLFLILFLLFLFPVMSAIEINMDSEILQGQTVIASIEGNFLDPITPSNIQFYRGYVRTSFEPNVAKIGNFYYIYFQTIDKPQNNYSINITGVRYFVGAQISTQQISKNFIITNETADFSISNGFMISSENFSLRVQSLKEQDVNIALSEEVFLGSSKGSLEFLFDEQKVDLINLHSGQTKYFEVGLNGITETTVRNIHLVTDNLEYVLPVYLIMGNVSINETETNTTDPTEDNETDNPNEDNETNNDFPNNSSENKTCTWFTKLFGCEEQNCTDNCTSLGYECGERTVCGKNVNCGNCSQGNSCQTNGTCMKIPCTDTCSSLKYSCGERTVCGKNVNCGNCSQGNSCQTNGTCIQISGSLVTKTCAEINGTICPQGKSCANNTVTTKDANCCLSSCVEKKGENNKKIVGWIIILVLGILILWFFILKFRKTKKTKDTILGGKDKR